ncbi:Tex family protein [Fusibacter bizertensis]|uniref:Tex family protein n=1 Tax=Fusibacter bizertensis TaxID=1488331 RepID=A0ABT6NDX6_9FIRM|nr:Tex family protein [Fusibacter bizertensis]MDH8678616.1 Tex family protein [Fusibacter bizertensis]
MNLKPTTHKEETEAALEAEKLAIIEDAAARKLIVAQLSKELALKSSQVESTIALIDEGNTIPFIARYRKEVTGGISDEVLRNFDDRLKYLRNLQARKNEVLRIIDEQGKLTPELKADIEKATVLQTVEDLYRPYKQKKSTRASKAIDRGLEPLADVIWSQEMVSGDFDSIAATYIDAEKEVATTADAIAGAMDIIAERISDHPENRAFIRKMSIAQGVVESTAVNDAESTVFDMYYKYSEPISKIVNHRILAMNRGESEKILKVKLNTPDALILERLEKAVVTNPKAITTGYLVAAMEDAYKRLISPSIEREIRSMLTERAEEEAIKVFGKNTKSLLLVAPVKDARVLAVDPSYRTGCKLAVLDETGKLLEYATIYPNAPQNKVEEAKVKLTELIKKHRINIIPIGNGTASRETEQLIAELIKELKEEVYYTIVSEAGASVYSASKLATEEYPDIDVSIRGAISIGRRLQDPLAELVKIDPKSIGVGQYQHDVNQKRLEEQLTNVVEDCVNSVGVDLNTATPSLLSYVSGVSSAIAKNIVAYRDENGKFKSRKELLKVKRLGDKAYQQAVGFMRIPKAKNPLDNTAVHPESYETTNRLLDTLGFSQEDIASGAVKDIVGRVILQSGVMGSQPDAMKYQMGLEKLSKQLDIGVLTLKDIVDEIVKPGRDPREDMPKPIFRSDVLKMEDLQVGMIMQGTVRNVVDFGAFVDIGVKQDGLVHISEICDRFIKHPMQVLSVGDNVKVQIISIDLNRHKIGMTMKNIKES